MTSFTNKADNIINENVKYIKTVTRVFYPKNMKLSPELIKAFKVEHDTLVKGGVDSKKAFDKICKALRFHV